ncbi:MAG: Fic family protein [Lewinellaceae bacterium]|nr:Fic family protein [Lewinellaceae bacterium]
MLIEAFDAGHYSKGAGYRYFVPAKVNRQWNWKDAKLNTLLEKASFQIGQLNSYAHLAPNIDLFIHLHITKEAVVSSRIEGTRTRMDEALLSEEYISPERRDDWEEVRNYTQALNEAIEQLKTLPLSSRLIRAAHKTLLQGVRGEHKMPGEFRRSQNWIGGASIDDARFIPPAHTYINELMGDLEHFLHNDQIDVPALIRIGIAHYQFETIHPFLDGNGRIGRLLITLYLVSEKILDQPLLYLSAFFEQNKGLYYDNLNRAREKSDLLHWCKYFLVGIEKTARKASNTLSEVLLLKQQLESQIHQNWGRRVQSALTLLNVLFQDPFVNVKDVEAICNLSPKAAGSLIQSFEDSGILKEFTGQSRNRMFVFEEYLGLFK